MIISYHQLQLIIIILISLALIIISTSTNYTAQGAWVNHGGGILNHRSAISNINSNTIHSLELKWAFKTGFDVSATPALVGRATYFPGWDGNLYALNSHNGHVIWRKNLTRLIGATSPTLARSTPVIYKHLLILGLHGPAMIIALNRHSGSLLWKSDPLDNAPLAVITMSGTAFDGFYYVGTSSIQEFTPVCCTFQGSFQKIRLSDGKVVWKTPMVPPNSGYSGVAVWGSSPPIDVKRRRVYIATGNNYQVPKEVEECEAKRTSESTEDTCMDKDVHLDSILALDMDTGAIIWNRRLQGYDVWTYPCSQTNSNPNCPKELGPDYDFGEAPMLLDFSTNKENKSNNHATNANTTKCTLVCGQKSGVVWALECETGNTIWSTIAGPGGTFGGASWGSCTDGERVYTNIINSLGSNFTIMPGGKEVTTNGGWVALDGRTGNILWTRAVPGNSTRAFAPLSIAIASDDTEKDCSNKSQNINNNVVIAPSFSSDGQIYALDALTGSILWNHSTGANIHGGYSISSNCIFGGNGYNTSIPGLGLPGTSFYAFCLPPSKHSCIFDPFSWFHHS